MSKVYLGNYLKTPLKNLCIAVVAITTSNITWADKLIDLRFENNITNQGTLDQTLLTPQWSNSPAYTMGAAGFAAQFTPETDNSIFTANDISELVGHDAITVSVDVLPDQTTNRMRPVWHHMAYGIQIQGNTVTAYLSTVENGYSLSANIDSLYNGEWHNIAVNYDAATGIARLYVDAEVVAERNDVIGTLAAPQRRELKIGTDGWGKQYYGLIDNVKIYNEIHTPTTGQTCNAITIQHDDFTEGDFPVNIIDGMAEDSLTNTLIPYNADITYTFDGDYECGQFVSGDWWVVGPLSIVDMAPAFANDRHGYSVNPQMNQQSLDGRVTETYVTPPALPLVFNEGFETSSVLKANSFSPQGNCRARIANYDRRSCLLSVGILTVLDQAPEEGAFRPPYVAGPKPMVNINDVNITSLPSLPTIDATPALDVVQSFWGGPYIDHIIDWTSRFIHPRASMRAESSHDNAAYGARLSNVVSQTVLRLSHDDTPEEKMTLATPLTQWGIDLFYQHQAGQTWNANGGHMSGRKLPILVAGKLLSNTPLGQSMLAIGSGDFQEDNHIYYNNDGEALFGLSWGNYVDKLFRCGGKQDVRDPDMQRDGGVVTFQPGSEALAIFTQNFGEGGLFVDENNPPAAIVDVSYTSGCPNDVRVNAQVPTIAQQIASGISYASNYQDCCTSRPYVYTATAVKLLDLEEAWNHPAFFDYVERWTSPPWNNRGIYNAYYGDEMFNAYYNITQ